MLDLHGMQKLLVPVVSAALLLSPTLAAQPAPPTDDDPSFRTLSVGLHALPAFTADALRPDWAPRPGVELTADTPLRPGIRRLDGIARLSVRYTPVEARAAFPAFDLLGVTMGWRRPVRLHRRIAAVLGGHLGNTYFHFEDPALPPTLRRESELTAGWTLGLDLSLPYRWTIEARAERSVVFTAPRLRTGVFAFGLRRTFDLPDRLTTFLR